MPLRAAARVAFSPSRLVMLQRPATRLAVFSVAVLRQSVVVAGTRLTSIYTGTLRLVARPGVRFSFDAPLRVLMAQRPGTNVVQATIVGTHLSHVVTAAQDAGGTGTWQNPTNMQGSPEGTRAGSSTFAGGLILGTGKLRGTALVAQANRAYQIDSVWLRFHYETSGLAVVSDLISQLALGFRIGTSPLPGPDRDMAVISANENFLVAGREIRIDDGAGKFLDGVSAAVSTPVTWANIALLQPYFSASTIANGLMSYYADGIRLRVEFSDIALL